MPSIIAHYQEIALKGRTVPWFLLCLVRNLRELLADLSVREVRTPMGRIDIVFDREEHAARVARSIGACLRSREFSLARRTPLTWTRSVTILQDLPHDAVPSFRVALRRADKRFPVTISRNRTHHRTSCAGCARWKVDLSHPAFVIWIEIVPGEAFYHFGKLSGAGGLPVGTSGRVAVLLSGGIDSPVAVWRR